MDESVTSKPYLIPTKRKALIPNSLSFPIGAEKISTGLISAPQINELVLIFVQDWYDRVHFKKYPFLSVKYIEKDWPANLNPYYGRWCIQIHPVRRSFRDRIQKHILSDTLPAIVK